MRGPRLAAFLTLAAVTTACSHPAARFAADRDRLTTAFTEFTTAADLPPGDTAALPHVRKALAAGDSVSDAYLDWLNPAMRSAFRTEYMAGQHLSYDGLVQGDTAEQRRGNALILQWRQGFWHTNGDAIFRRAFGRAP
jgi:hypothetical protein